MFPESEVQPRTVKKSWLTSKKAIILLAGAVVVCMLVLLGTLVATGVLGGSTVKIPDTITQKVKSPIYLPAKLPGNYQLDASSFNFVEEDGVLVFDAKDSIDSKLIFSQQARPKGFDFEHFHQGNFEDPKILSNVPYPSIWGKAIDGRFALSIVTDDTWIIVVTSSSLSEDEMTQVVQSLRKY